MHSPDDDEEVLLAGLAVVHAVRLAGQQNIEMLKPSSGNSGLPSKSVYLAELRRSATRARRVR